MTSLAPPTAAVGMHGAARDPAPPVADSAAALAVLHAAGHVLRTVPHSREALSRVASLLVPALCELVVLEVQEPGGARSSISIAHLPELAKRAREALERDGVSLLHGDDHAVQRALREQLGGGELVIVRLHGHGVLIVSAACNASRSAPFRLLIELVGEQISIYLETAELRSSVERERSASHGSRDKAESDAMLLGVVSHELRNPLAVIMLAVSLLKERGLAAHQESVVRRLETAGRQSERLVADLLDFTAARRVGIALTRAERDLHAVVGAALDDLRDAWPNRLIEHDHTGDGLSFIDEGRIAQVVMNLVGNALQHSPPASSVRVETHGDSGAVRLRVANAGEPIPAELIPQLFEPLRRGPRAGKRTGSLGLGLFIVRHLVLAHGGHIEVTSTADLGTRFDIHLPRAEARALSA